MKIGISVNPWDLPLHKIISNLPIKVFVIDLRNNDDVLHEIDLDLGNVDHRKYLGKITAWALTNHYSVETMSKLDAEGVDK